MTEEKYRNLPEGGYLIPEVVTRKRPGVVAAIKRFLRMPGGWEEYRLADAMREEASRMAKAIVKGIREAQK